MSTQSMKALALANEIRWEGARIRRVLGELPPDESRRAAAELLRDPPPAVAAMRVGHFLSSIKRFGQFRAMRFMRDAGLNGAAWDRRIGPATGSQDNAFPPLTARQRNALANVLDPAFGKAA